MGATSTVTITIVGVREERLPRLKTLIKSEISRFGSSVRVEDDRDVPAEKPTKKGR